MGGQAREGDVDLGGGEEAGFGDIPLTEFRVATDVRAEEVVDMINPSLGDHALGAAGAFLARLEEQDEAAAEFIPVVRDPGGEGETDGRVRVVVAGVHAARNFGGVAALDRLVLGIGRFGQHHAVDVKAKRKRLAFAARVEKTDGAGVAARGVDERLRHAVGERAFDGGLHLGFVSAHDGFGRDGVDAELHVKAEAFERADDFVCGFEFAPARLRTLVNGASKRYGEVEILLSEGHGSFLLIVAGDWARWIGPCAGTGSIPCGRPFQGLGPLRRTACGAVTIIENLMAAEKTN